jgi:hypothetical protein
LAVTDPCKLVTLATKKSSKKYHQKLKAQQKQRLKKVGTPHAFIWTIKITMRNKNNNA